MREPNVVDNRDSLRKRVRRFIDAELFAHKDANQLLSALVSAGETAIFGGLLRDLALWGGKEFYSDVDLVIDYQDSNELGRLLKQWSPTRNSFGGYRLSVGRWVLDIWTLESTWAFRQGLVDGRKIPDLLNTTFFNWDAIVFKLESNRLSYSDHYLSDLSQRKLSINLRNCANELGATVRTLRLLAQASPKLDPQLASFLFENINHYGSSEILRSDAKSKGKRVLTADFVGTTAIALRHHQHNESDAYFQIFEHQEELPLSHHFAGGSPARTV